MFLSASQTLEGDTKTKDKDHYNPVNRKRGLAYAVPMIEEVVCCCAMRVSNNEWAEKSSVLNAAINEWEDSSVVNAAKEMFGNHSSVVAAATGRAWGSAASWTLPEPEFG